MRFHFLGVVDYDVALQRQQDLWCEVRRGQPGVVLGLEHPRVVTLGRRGNPQTDVLSESVSVVFTDRGGQTTVHNPGQLVVYPIVNLRQLGLGPRRFVEILMTVTQQVICGYGVRSLILPGRPGLFVEGHSGAEMKKIASFGIRISHGVTTHGLSLNVINDLGDFNLIRSCGVSCQPVTNLEIEKSLSGDNWGSSGLQVPTLEDLFSVWQNEFLKVLTHFQNENTLERSLRI